LNFLLIKEFWEKQHTVTVYNIDKKYFLSSKSALEWFLKDHVTLKAGVMITRNIDILKRI